MTNSQRSLTNTSSTRRLACAAVLLACVNLHAQTPSAPAANPIQPKDGLWNWTMGAMQSSASCMPGVAQSLAQLLPQQRSEQVQFDTPFHPAQLVKDSAISWQQRSPNHFIAVANGITVQGFPLPLNARYELFVLSPTRMRGDATVEMNVWQVCKVQAPFDFERQEQATPAARTR
ncbi:hypothetical protein E8K88_02355 [Lampropedia aestuarii]|uniref:Uncharacterized protein n=1 Tax=Lampropedia aestuarii TaxID=2562762 RepID=A0A4S5C107_9BURK|nr:hypothetical protein [Lampropedia aestuarii]THJ36128.1 hypothetical protein E8K88_02355 [Lampropedia aestuarii]